MIYLALGLLIKYCQQTTLQSLPLIDTNLSTLTRRNRDRYAIETFLTGSNAFMAF